MAGRTSETVVEVEVPEGGVEIVAPHQADHPPAKPDAFRVGGRPPQELGGLGKLVELPLAVLLGVGVRVLGPGAGLGV